MNISFAFDLERPGPSIQTQSRAMNFKDTIIMGRKPTPTFLKRITGNPDRRPLNQGKPHVGEPLGSAPSSWEADAKKVWSAQASGAHYRREREARV